MVDIIKRIVTMLCVSPYPLISADNQNKAHHPDVFNPKWYVQTQEVKLELHNKEVSVQYSISIYFQSNSKAFI